MKIIKHIAILLCFITAVSCKKSSSSGNGPGPGPGTGGGVTNPPAVDSTVIRGAWVTTTASTALGSRADIKATVSNFKAAGLNHIFVVVYNNARTVYPSTVMQNLIGIPIKEGFEGRDPLQELIEEAHAAKLKVHAWFEYGFSSSYSANGGLILQAKPDWASKNQNGALVVKNGFDWLNALHPEVQDFMISLIKEVVTKYNVDGIQGDDRLPAMPSEGGYDTYTVNLYKAENAGASPPANIKDAGWLQWRA
ncbi:MAG TPA: family 10 glycosylhydrolase, partial [Chitinophagaceae bacterium]